MSLSLHSSMECGGSISFGSRNSSDIVSEKSRIVLISDRISSRPDAVPSAADSRHSGEPISHRNDEVCRDSRSGTSSGSVIRAKEMRRGARVDGAGAVEREAAKWGPSLVPAVSKRARQAIRHEVQPDDHGRSNSERKIREAAQSASIASKRLAVEQHPVKRGHRI